MCSQKCSWKHTRQRSPAQDAASCAPCLIFLFKETALCFSLPMVFSTDPPWIQLPLGDLWWSLTAIDEYRTGSQGNSWKTSRWGLAHNSVSWTSLTCKYNRHRSHSVKLLPSACTTWACSTTNMPLQDSIPSWPMWPSSHYPWGCICEGCHLWGTIKQP